MDYWNHNSAYHPPIVKLAKKLHGDALDVGCGEGLLVERLSRASRHVAGVDRDEQAIRRAERRTSELTNCTVNVADFLAMPIAAEAYDLVTFVASLHHMDLVMSLQRSDQILRPGGVLIVVGLSADKSLSDYTMSAIMLPAVRILSRIHHETRPVQVVAVPPGRASRR